MPIRVPTRIHKRSEMGGCGRRVALLWQRAQGVGGAWEACGSTVGCGSAHEEPVPYVAKIIRLQAMRVLSASSHNNTAKIPQDVRPA